MSEHPELAWGRGLAIGTVSYDEAAQSWWFGFATHGGIQLFCPWRLRRAGSVLLASGDHGQQYGLPAPVDGVGEATKLLAARRIEDLVIDPETADLRLRLDGGVTIETFGDGTGYEMWHLIAPDDRMFVGQGGAVRRIRRDGPLGHGEPLGILLVVLALVGGCVASPGPVPCHPRPGSVAEWYSHKEDPDFFDRPLPQAYERDGQVVDRHGDPFPSMAGSPPAPGR